MKIAAKHGTKAQLTFAFRRSVSKYFLSIVTVVDIVYRRGMLQTDEITGMDERKTTFELRKDSSLTGGGRGKRKNRNPDQTRRCHPGHQLCALVCVRIHGCNKALSVYQTFNLLSLLIHPAENKELGHSWWIVAGSKAAALPSFVPLPRVSRPSAAAPHERIGSRDPSPHRWTPSPPPASNFFGGATKPSTNRKSA